MLETIRNFLARLSRKMRGKLTLDQRFELAKAFMHSKGFIDLDQFDRAVRLIEGASLEELKRNPSAELTSPLQS